MAELPGRGGIVDRSSIRKGVVGPKPRAVVGAGLGGLALLPAIYALVLCFTLLSGPHSSEGWWWLLILGIVAAYGLAAPPRCACGSVASRGCGSPGPIGTEPCGAEEPRSPPPLVWAPTRDVPSVGFWSP